MSQDTGISFTPTYSIDLAIDQVQTDLSDNYEAVEEALSQTPGYTSDSVIPIYANPGVVFPTNAPAELKLAYINASYALMDSALGQGTGTYSVAHPFEIDSEYLLIPQVKFGTYTYDPVDMLTGLLTEGNIDFSELVFRVSTGDYSYIQGYALEQYAKHWAVVTLNMAIIQ